MKHLKKSLLPLFLAIAMLVMALSVGATETASSPRKTNLKDLTTSLNYESTSYTNKKKTPKLIASDGTLKKNRDYTASYSNNLEIGTAKAIFTGIGQYKGKVTKTFTITRQKLHIGNMTLKKGKKASLVAYVYLKDVETKMPVSQIKYKSSNKGVATVSSSGKVTTKKKGTCKITLTPKDTKHYSAKTITITVN